MLIPGAPAGSTRCPLMPRPPIPAPARRLLLPVWNRGHHLARRAGEYADAVRRRRLERCAACGRFGPMLYRRRVVPPKLEAMWGLSPRLADALARKESCACWACGAKLRARRLARVLLELYGPGSRCVREWAATPGVRSLRIAEINLIEGLHEQLAGLPGLSYSDFRGAGGAVDPGAPHEDLTALSYPEAAFDLVLTSETLEHVSDLDAALAEIRRVLKPGGRHLFTVPLMPGVARSCRRTDGLCHPGGDVGYPVVTEFGADLPAILQAAGFDAEMRFGPITEEDVSQVWVTSRLE